MSLNLTLSKLQEKNEWFSIKNAQNEIILMVLLSFKFDGATEETEQSPVKKPSRNSENMSFDKIKMHLNKSEISNTIGKNTKITTKLEELNNRDGQNNSHIVNISHLDMNNISHISKINVSCSKKTHFPNAQSNGFSNAQNDISIFSNNNNNLTAKHQYQNSNPSELKKNMNPIDGSEYISTLDSILEADEESNSKKISYENYNEAKSI